MGREQGMIKTIDGFAGRFAGETVRKKVMEGSEKITAKTGKTEIAEWVKGAMDRLDALVGERVRTEIMENCGYKCSEVNRRVIEGVKVDARGARAKKSFLRLSSNDPCEELDLQGKETCYTSFTHHVHMPNR